MKILYLGDVMAEAGMAVDMDRLMVAGVVRSVYLGITWMVALV